MSTTASQPQVTNFQLELSEGKHFIQKEIKPEITIISCHHTEHGFGSPIGDIEVFISSETDKEDLRKIFGQILRIL